MFLLFLACTGDAVDTGVADTEELVEEVVDLDQDGSPSDLDCNDNEAQVHPGAVEVCDGLDNDCDGAVDLQAVDASPYWIDQDGDGWGGGEPVMSCTQPAGAVELDGDCDDSDESIRPDAQEVCDELDVDEDCDGLSDDADDSVDPLGFSEFYADADGDGLGDAGEVSLSCDATYVQVDNDLDCDDSEAEIGEECEGWNGRYTGSFELKFSVPDLSVNDSCVGTIELEVLESYRTQISGLVECSFSGFLGTVIGADWSASIIGGFDSADSALGELELSGLLTDTWEGAFVDDTLTGDLSGSTVYEGYRVSFSGHFEATR